LPEGGQLKTLMLERGKDIEHVKGYVNANKEKWEFEHRDQRTQQMISEHDVLKRDYPLNEQTYGMWENDKQNPYTETKRFDWYRGYHVGGRSLMWGRQSYRWNKWDFEANAKEGIAVDWPIRYDEIAPWYSYVEKFAGIQGSKEGLEVLPDSEFLPAMELNCAEKEVKQKIRTIEK
jgi:choline dehydrogenase-like flavoprotein